jgi:hypothetical protein
MGISFFLIATLRGTLFFYGNIFKSCSIFSINVPDNPATSQKFDDTGTWIPGTTETANLSDIKGHKTHEVRVKCQDQPFHTVKSLLNGLVYGKLLGEHTENGLFYSDFWLMRFYVYISNE